MGAEQQDENVSPVVVAGLQPVALIDHVALVDWSDLEDCVPGEKGGSIRVNPSELDSILGHLTHLKKRRTLAGGSVANTVRGLTGVFGIKCRIVGARGDDEKGDMFASNMQTSGVDLSRLRIKSGPTGQCACLVDALGNRTMRPCLSDAVRLQASELKAEDFRGLKWLVLNGYGFYGEELVERAIQLAKQEGVLVSMDLASFEVVRTFRTRLIKLLQTGMVDLCFANQDEARELTGGTPESGLEFLSKYCTHVVVMLGPEGCIAKSGDKIIQANSVDVGGPVVDTTGAGDLFASGFLYGMINGLTLEECCKIGCCSGAAVIQDLGGEIHSRDKKWMFQKMKSFGL